MKPTLREQESCMCIKCLNIHCIYKSLRTNCPELDLPDSLTEYLTSSFRCMRDENIKFHTLECINSTCSSTCKIKSSIEQFKFDINRKEINKLIGRINQDGLTLIPTKLYFLKGKVKVEIAVAKGKKLYDKRQVKKKTDAQFAN